MQLYAVYFGRQKLWTNRSTKNKNEHKLREWRPLCTSPFWWKASLVNPSETVKTECFRAWLKIEEKTQVNQVRRFQGIFIVKWESVTLSSEFRFCMLRIPGFPVFHAIADSHETSLRLPVYWGLPKVRCIALPTCLNIQPNIIIRW